MSLTSLQTTWQFTSIDLLQQQQTPTEHKLIDDLESVFWVLVWGALHYCKHSHNFFLSGPKNLFDEVEMETEADGRLVVYGGRKKLDILDKGKLVDFSFESVPLRNLISTLAKQFSKYHSFKRMHSEEPARFTEVQQRLKNPEWWIEQFNRAIEEPAWPEKDIVPDQFIAQSEKTTHQLENRAAKMTNIVSKRRMNTTKSAGMINQIKPLAKRTALVRSAKSAAAGAKRKAADPQDPESGPSSSRGRKKPRVGK